MGSTPAKFQDPDSIIGFQEKPEPDPDIECMGEGSALMTVFAGATHAEHPKGVISELLQKIWRIDAKTSERTI